jgi:hypothetical protein
MDMDLEKNEVTGSCEKIKKTTQAKACATFVSLVAPASAGVGM